MGHDPNITHPLPKYPQLFYNNGRHLLAYEWSFFSPGRIKKIKSFTVQIEKKKNSKILNLMPCVTARYQKTIVIN